ncbi:ATP-dependent Clp protease proteolytic subunit [Euzebya pacifica]|jgi:ATP-dependent Clp protease protease subunit|uniref:ATP-dependent Clp protease proteolytic subunit n=1 Tax=Euzebya pacifica TaxID=1608957 RepID=A0A346XXF6_9ACTN|nr:ATP-dependent Clp protease proteolytic subunit [Euzebya pacifica]AXV06903.1 ATP-dependent Clp protease proteolytic subunit [Euzebya pacifica]
MSVNAGSSDTYWGLTPRSDDGDEETKEEKDTLLAAALSQNPFKKLYDNRVLYLRGPIEDTKADEIVAQLLALGSDSDDDITMYINSPGGVISGMFAMYDVMHLINAKVNTVCVGMAASAGAFLLATGTGTRSATPNSRIMIHQPLGGARGQASDIQIQAQQMTFMRNRINEILSERSGKSLEQVEKDTLRDFWLSAEESVEYGLIDSVRTTGGL